MAKEFVALPTHPSEMDTLALVQHLGDSPDSEVVRSLLIAETDAIRAGAEREHRTMRGLWYALVKPALSRMGILNKLTTGGKPVDWARKLSVYLAELVRDGYTTYEELYIIDGSRQRQVAEVIGQDVIDQAILVGGEFPWLILFTEKDTIWGVVQRIASLYGVSAISGGGEPSNACTEHTVRRILRDPYYKESPHSIILLSLTDYDPWGYTIANAQFTQIQEALATADDENGARRPTLAYHERLGLTPDQLEPDELEANAYEPSRTGLKEWFAATGGVNGQPLGLELDALPLSRLRGMFADGIERYIDLEKRRDDLRAAFVDLLACELLKPDFEADRQRLNEATMGSGAWESVTSTKIPDDLFRRAAVAGLYSIDPLEMPKALGTLFDCADEVRDVMREALEVV